MAGWGRIYNNANYALRVHSNLLARIQEQIGTGARLVRTSDAPADSYRVMHLNTQTASLQVYTENVETVASNFQTILDQLSSISNAVTAAQVSLSAAASDNNAAERDIYAGQINELLEQVAMEANFQTLGHYIFSGADVTTKPYEVVKDGDRIVAVNYQGSYDEMPVQVAPGTEYSGTLVGDRVFRRDHREPPVFFGSTGAAPGAGTPSVRGDVWVSVSHTSTDFTGGFASGTDSGSDTILGDHVLHVDGPGETIQLDDGAVVSFDGTETNLRLTNAAGEVVYVDTTGAGGANGDYTITGNGTLSIDGGVSTTAIDFSDANQAVTDLQSGRVLYVDSQNITRAGVESVRVPGTYDLFGTLINVRDLLLNTRGLSQEEQTRLLSEALSSLDEVARGIARTTSSVGTRWQALDTLHNEGGTGTLDNLIAANDAQKSFLVDADIVELSIEMFRTQTLYQMTLTSTAQLLSLSLLDFI